MVLKKKKVEKVKKAKPKAKPKAKAVVKKEKLVAGVVHYYDHIKVAVLKLKAPLAVGDTIRIEGGENTNFKQKITSIQAEHKALKKAKKGQEIGLKVKEKVRDGYKVYK